MENGYNPVTTTPSDDDVRQSYQSGYRQGWNDAFGAIVRCKDCKHRVEPSKMCKHPKAVGWDAIEPDDNDFCSCGERRDENDAT